MSTPATSAPSWTATPSARATTRVSRRRASTTGSARVQPKGSTEGRITVHGGGREARGRCRVGDGLDVDGAGEPVAGALAGVEGVARDLQRPLLLVDACTGTARSCKHGRWTIG